MVQAVIVIIAALILFSTFCIVRGIIRLYRSAQHKRAVFCTVAFALIPLLIWGCVSVAEVASKPIWAYLPVVFFALLWMAGGFALTVFMRKSMRARLDAMLREDPMPPDHWLLKCFGCGAGAVAVWAFGTFVGFSSLAILEVLALCVMVALLGSVLYILWQCRDSF